MMFPECKLIEEGGYVIDNKIDSIRDAILKKDGIVDTENTNDFRFFVGNCLNQNMLNQVGGEMNTFEKKSFRRSVTIKQGE